MDVAVAASAPQVVDWHGYFYSIREECPWSWQSWQQGKISIEPWTGQPEPLADWHARVYVTNMTHLGVAHCASVLDQDPDVAWLYSHPGRGPFSTQQPVLIQQDRAQLEHLRSRLDSAGSGK